MKSVTVTSDKVFEFEIFHVGYFIHTYICELFTLKTLFEIVKCVSMIAEF